MHLLRRMVSKNVALNSANVKENETTTAANAPWTLPNSPVPYPERTDSSSPNSEILFCKPQSAFVNEETTPLPSFFNLEDDSTSSCNMQLDQNSEFDQTTSSSTSEQFHLFFQLPCELQLYVLRFISAGDVYSIQLACKSLYTLTGDNFLWKHWTTYHFNICDHILVEYGKEVRDQWEQYYKTQTLLHNKKGEIVSERILNVINRPKVRFAQTGSVVDGIIYYIGGQMSDKRSDEILAFNHQDNSFSQVCISNYDPNRSFCQSQSEVTGDCRNFIGIDGKVPSFARHQAVSIHGKIYVFGGYDYKFFYNLAIFDPSCNTWTYPNVFGDIPAPRSNHSAAVVDSKFYIFGGSVGDNVDKYCVTNDFYSFCTKTFTWTKISPQTNSLSPEGRGAPVVAPSARVGHVMTSLGNKVYMFGGGVWGKTTGWTEQYNDLYIFDTEREEWEVVEIKSEEKPGVCTYPYVFTIGQNVMLFGGASMVGSTVTNKLYCWDVMQRKWTELEFAKGSVNVNANANAMNLNEISARSIGTANRVGENEVVVWGGYCGGLLDVDNDLFKFKLQLKEKRVSGVVEEGDDDLLSTGSS